MAPALPLFTCRFYGLTLPAWLRIQRQPDRAMLLHRDKEDERRRLEASVLQDGCRDPLVVWLVPQESGYCKECEDDVSLHDDDGRWVCDRCQVYGVVPEEGVILDGYNRYNICRQHGITFETTEAPEWIETRDDAKYWIIQHQLGRRNLTAYQRAELALQLEPLIAVKAKEHQPFPLITLQPIPFMSNA